MLNLHSISGGLLLKRFCKCVLFGWMILVIPGMAWAGGVLTPVSGPESFPLTWTLETGVRVPNGRTTVIAPDIQQMSNGIYRMYYTVSGEGVGSAISQDGLKWTVEKGFRIRSKRHEPGYQMGDLGFDLGHPWLVPLPDGGWRMFLQANYGLQTPCRIVSAGSHDGFQFDMEDGTRINIGPQSGYPPLSFAGHGRTWVQADGTYAMVFSGNLQSDHSPSDIMLATSRDGMMWTIVNPNLFTDGHDPTILKAPDGKLFMVFSYLKECLKISSSLDGIHWEVPRRMQLFNPDGSPVREIFGDVDLVRLSDGSLRMYSNGPGGILSFIPQSR